MVVGIHWRRSRIFHWNKLSAKAVLSTLGVAIGVDVLAEGLVIAAALHCHTVQLKHHSPVFTYSVN